MTRPTTVHIYLDRLVHNLRVLQKIQNTGIIPVVKANAYGHGSVVCARALEPMVALFAVASLEEAFELRTHGIKKPIVLLEGVFEASEWQELAPAQMIPVVHHSSQWELAPTSLEGFMGLWLKVDTGMHRLGFTPSEALKLGGLWNQLWPKIPKVLMTHFARADESDASLMNDPWERFSQCLHYLPWESSVANSATLLGHHKQCGNWARPGIALYGINPLKQINEVIDLQPVMRLCSQIQWIKWIEPHEPIGYGGIFRTKRKTRLGIIPCGYGDGYPRMAPEGTPVWVSGARVPLVGRVSMDMLTVDLTDFPWVQTGDAVELWGDGVSVAEIAKSVGTLPYELLGQIRRAHQVIHSC